MGNGIKLECKKCGFDITASLGIGFLYPIVCEKTLQRIKDGEFGDEFKDLANNTPNAAVHQEESLFVCDKCGDIVVDDVIDLCVPIKGVRCGQKFCSCIDYPDNITYVMRSDIGDTYKVVCSVEHKCSKCNDSIRVIKQTPKVLKSLKCPKCKELLSISQAYLWD